jgi:putative hydrolase of the HAD superfamily
MIEFVFDLDDTLYHERDYVRSALHFVGEWVASHYGGLQVFDRLWDLFEAGSKDPVSEMWRAEAFPNQSKLLVLAEMRQHRPVITLRGDAQRLLKCLRQRGRGFSIVTDGRSITQRAKLEALGCLDAKFVSISEEVGIEKTDILRFEAINRLFLADGYCYVGDNPMKDFVAPNTLGWTTVMLKGTEANIHSQVLGADPDFWPKRIICNLGELEDMIEDRTLAV